MGRDNRWDPLELTVSGSTGGLFSSVPCLVRRFSVPVVWHWKPDIQGDREAMAGWIALDTGLGDEDDFDQAMALCRAAAGWPQ